MNSKIIRSFTVENAKSDIGRFLMVSETSILIEHHVEV
jgi:hypothetical protein